MSRQLSDPCVHWEEYVAADWASDIVFTGASPAFPGLKAVVIDVVDTTDGTSLVVKTVGAPSIDTTWTVAAGDRVECQINSIDEMTSVTRLRVGFSDGR